MICFATVPAPATPAARASWWDDFDANGLDARICALGEFDGALVGGGSFTKAGATPACLITTRDAATRSD